ncbi:MAG: polysaccharide biosynthesis/export family protein [Terriglobales bacterium]
MPASKIVWFALLAAPLTAQAPVSVSVPPPAAQRLEPGDLVAITVLGAPELASDARLDASGAITLPEAGTVDLAGMSTAEAERALAARWSANYLLAPQVHLNVREFAPQPVTVLGAVKNPGVYSARTYPDLAAMLAAAGGLGSDPGSRIVVSHLDADALVPGQSLDLEGLARDGAGATTPMRAGDVVRVVPAATVTVGGDVLKPGAYPLPASGLTLLGVLSLAGGVTRDGSASHARIVRRTTSGGATPIWVDASRVLQGRAPDPPLQPFDLVFVPHSTAHAAIVHGIETAIGTGAAILSGLIVFH